VRTTLGDIANWIIANRKGKAFPYSYDTIIHQLVEAERTDAILCVIDGDTILGVVCGRWLPGRIYYVDDILTIKSKVVKHMMNYFLEHYPDFTIQGLHRSKRARNFTNIKKLTERL